MGRVPLRQRGLAWGSEPLKGKTKDYTLLVARLERLLRRSLNTRLVAAHPRHREYQRGSDKQGCRNGEEVGECMSGSAAGLGRKVRGSIGMERTDRVTWTPDQRPAEARIQARASAEHTTGR